jgi:hypothetical protein
VQISYKLSRHSLGICAKNKVSIVFLLAVLPAGAVTVSTGQYDMFRSSTNLNETTLNTANVNPTQFGRLGAYAVDGQVHAQPLFIPGLIVNGAAVNVLFVATQHNSIYAFNADKVGSAPLWQINLAPSVTAKMALNGQCPAYSTGSELGILATPVIDTSTNSLYAVYATPLTATTYTFYIAALDIATGRHKAGSPNQITASAPGTAYDAVNGVVTLSNASQISRPA